MPDVTSSLPHIVAPEKRSPRLSKGTVYWWLSWAAPVAFVLLWEAFARSGLVSAQVLPASSRVLETAWGLAKTGELFVDLGVSLLRALAGATNWFR